MQVTVDGQIPATHDAPGNMQGAMDFVMSS